MWTATNGVSDRSESRWFRFLQREEQKFYTTSVKTACLFVQESFGVIDYEFPAFINETNCLKRGRQKNEHDGLGSMHFFFVLQKTSLLLLTFRVTVKNLVLSEEATSSRWVVFNFNKSNLIKQQNVWRAESRGCCSTRIQSGNQRLTGLGNVFFFPFGQIKTFKAIKGCTEHLKINFL